MERLNKCSIQCRITCPEGQSIFNIIPSPMERAEFQHEQKANVRNLGEGLSTKPDSYTETKDLLKNKRPLTRVCSVRQSSRTYPTSPSERYADFGKSGAESGTRPSEQVCNERQNPDKDLKRMQGCEPPTIQDADFGKCAVRVAQQHAQHVPVKNLMQRSNSDSGYEVECKAANCQ